DNRWRKGLSGRSSSSNCSARSKVASSMSPLVNIRLQLRDTSFSVSKVVLLWKVTDTSRYCRPPKLHSIGEWHMSQSVFARRRAPATAASAKFDCCGKLADLGRKSRGKFGNRWGV